MKNKIIKNIAKISIISFLLVIYVYFVAIGNIPNNMVIFEGESISINSLFGLTLNIKNDNGIVETSSSTNKQTMK